MLKKRIEALESKITPTTKPTYFRFVSPNNDGTEQFGYGWFLIGGEWHISQEGEPEPRFLERINAENYLLINGNKAVKEIMEKDDC